MIKLNDLLDEIRRQFNTVELGLEADPEDDYEIEHVTRGSNQTHAFADMKMWAKENGYDVEEGQMESIFDAKFKKDGNVYRVVEL